MASYKHCEKCIYRNAAQTIASLQYGCNYMLITGKMRPYKGSECKIGRKKENQGAPLKLKPFNSMPNDCIHTDYMAER